MTVTPGYFDLSPEQKKFRTILKAYPNLAPFWSFERRERDIPALTSRMKTMSHGERVLTQFFLGAWLGENSNGFDLVEAMKTLDEDGLSVIEHWVADPFFP